MLLLVASCEQHWYKQAWAVPPLIWIRQKKLTQMSSSIYITWKLSHRFSYRRKHVRRQIHQGSSLLFLPRKACTWVPLFNLLSPRSPGFCITLLNENQARKGRKHQPGKYQIIDGCSVEIQIWSSHTRSSMLPVRRSRYFGNMIHLTHIQCLL